MTLADPPPNSREIRAAITRKLSAPFTVAPLRLDAPKADEILVRIVGAGVCHTDLAVAEGHMPMAFPAVLGHEGAGIVEAVGASVTKVQPGDHVVLTFRTCGDCDCCRRGTPAYCHNGGRLNYSGAREDGSRTLSEGVNPVAGCFFGQSSFATFALTYERNTVKVDKDLPLWSLAPLGCGVQTGVGAAINSLRCREGSSLLVLGGGSVGLSAVMGGVVCGCDEIIVVEPHAARRELALELGATAVIDPGAEPDIAAAVRRRLPLGVEYAIDTTGKTALLEAAVDSLAKLGTLGLVGIPDPDAVLPAKLAHITRWGLTIRGVIEGDADPETFIPKMIELHRAGRLPFDRLITLYPFEDINQAVADQHDGRCVKVVLVHEPALLEGKP
jgi:aryl-alcohol dehydrogenase